MRRSGIFTLGLVTASALSLALAAVAWAPNEGGGGGGCHIGCYYVGFLSSSLPVDGCTAVYPHGQAIACTGWNNWDRSRVYKATGGSIRVGFWDPNNPPNNTIHYHVFSGVWVDPSPIVVLRTDSTMVHGAANSYNAVLCAWDSGTESSVECDALLFS
jgi:hypothetical protein